jgi:putative NIF3 family GTP cyclohydrolase 1 type 2
MKTKELMDIALALVEFDEVPEDSAVYVPGGDIKKVLFGLDIGAGELLMAQEMGYDAVIAHHPVGTTYQAWRVFERHVGLLTGAGVPEDAAHAAVAPKLEQLRLGGMVRNYEQVPQAAKLLKMPFLNIHCPLDELGRRVMQRTVNNVLEESPGATLADVVEALAALPAAQRAQTDVETLLGDPEAPAGKAVVAHGALTNGGYEIARAYFAHGIDTVVYIHIGASDLKRLREHDDGQLIVTGHLMGDAVGIAPYIKALRERGLEVDVLSDVLSQ